MSTVNVRKAGLKDAAFLAHVHHHAFSPAWDEAFFASLLRDGAVAWVSACLGRDAGFAIIRLAADEAELLSIAVLPLSRQHGAGQALLEVAIAGARQAGADNLFLEVASRNVPALHLYESNGFVRVGKRPHYYASDDDALTCRLPLR